MTEYSSRNARINRSIQNGICGTVAMTRRTLTLGVDKPETKCTAYTQ
jgi:hypothetical protein